MWPLGCGSLQICPAGFVPTYKCRRLAFVFAFSAEDQLRLYPYRFIGCLPGSIASSLFEGQLGVVERIRNVVVFRQFYPT